MVITKRYIFHVAGSNNVKIYLLILIINWVVSDYIFYITILIWIYLLF